MRAVGAPPRSSITAKSVHAAHVLALASAILVAGGTGLASAQDDLPPIGPSATIGTLGAARENGIVGKHDLAPGRTSPASAKETAAVADTPTAAATPSVDAASPEPRPEAVAASADSATAPSAAVPAVAPPLAAPSATPSNSAEAAAAPTATPGAAATAPALPAGSETFVINDGAAASGWTPVGPEAPAKQMTAGAPASAPAQAPIVPPDDAVSVSDGSTNVVQTVEPDEVPTGTTEIPQAAQETGVDAQNAQVANYEANQQMPLNEPQLHSLQEFMSEGVNASPLGVELEEGARRTRNGREVDGLLVVALQPGSPAERAGVQAGHRAAHDVAEGVAVAASLVFPPAVLAVPVIETVQFGENYDLIIGIDGNRVSNFMDFQDRLRDAQPGETVYLNILRSGKRLQVPVQMPPPNPSKLQP
jgi:hypothetical protein